MVLKIAWFSKKKNRQLYLKTLVIACFCEILAVIISDITSAQTLQEIVFFFLIFIFDINQNQ